MKKMRILALIMTCAILLSSIMIPVAAESTTPALNYTATNVVGKDITIDGYATAEEGWSKDPTFTLSAYNNTEVANEADEAGWSIDEEDPTEVRISYDEDFLYFFYETSRESGTHPWDTRDPKRQGKRVYLLIAPTDRSLLDFTTNTPNGESIMLVLNFYKPDDPTKAETVVWEGMDANGVVGTQAPANLVSQLVWTSDTTLHDAPFEGYFGKQNAIRDFKVVYAYNPATQTQSMEIKIPLAYSYKQALKTDAGASFRIGINERPYTSSNAGAGYTVAPGAFEWDLPVDEGVTLNLPKTNGTTRVAQNVAGKEITVDGVMGANEGWSEDAMFYTTWAGFDCLQSHEATFVDNNASKLRISTDGEKIYFFYEITRDELVNSGWINSGISTTYSAPQITFYLAPEGEHLETQTPADHCFALNLSIYRENLMIGVAPVEGVSGSFKWDGTLSSDQKWSSVANKDSVHIFQSMKYGFVDPSKVDGNKNKTYGSYEGGYLQGTEIAINRAANKKKLSIEIAVPVSEELGETLLTGTANYRVGVHEKTYKYNGQNTVDGNGSSNGGYFMSPGSLLCEPNSHEAPWNGNWMFLDNCGYTFTLPQVSSDKTSIAPELVGFQSREGAVAGTYDIRFVSIVDEDYALDLNASKLGYLFGLNGKTSMQYCTKVYTELNAGDGTIKAETYGGKYFFCFTITGLSKDTASYTFNAKCFTQYNETAQFEYCVEPVTVTVTYDTTNNKAVFS